MSEKTVSKAKKTAAKNKTFKVKLIRSTAASTAVQIACVRGLGLKKIGQVRELEDTPSVRGMATKVSHLVAIC